MAHFAYLNENNIVEVVVVISNDDLIDENGNEVEALGVAVCETVFGPGKWIQTSYNGSFRGVYAGIGYGYDEDDDVFLPPKPPVKPQPHPSWVLDPDTEDWVAPIPMPTDEGYLYLWDEGQQNWIAEQKPPVPPIVIFDDGDS